MGNHQDIINEAKMQSFKTELEAVTGINSILAIDIFFVHKFQNTQIKSFTYAVSEYLSKILPEYLEKHGSIGGVNEWRLEHKTISGDYNKETAYPFAFGELPFDSSSGLTSTFNDFIEYLEKQSFGNFVFWNNIPQKVGDAEANISALIISSTNCENKINEIKAVTHENLVRHFYRLIMNEFVEITLKDKEEINNHIRDKDFIKAHKHTIRNFGLELSLANIEAALDLNKIDKAREFLNRVQKVNLLRDISIDFIYRTNYSSTNKNKLLLLEELNKRGGVKYSEILKIINDATTGGDQHLVINNQVESSPQNKIEENNLVSAYNLLINLYSNAEKHSNNFQVNMKMVNNELNIEFINYSAISNESILKAINNKNINDVDEQKNVGDGLNIIINSLVKLNMGVIASSDTKKTTITLKIA